MVTGFFRWWYSEGIVQSGQIVLYAVNRITDFFSLPILIKTWTAPWKDDRLAAENASLSDQVKILELNFASRVVGFLVRTVVIAVVLLILAVLIILAVVGLAIWILVPFAWLLLPVVAVIVSYQ